MNVHIKLHNTIYDALCEEKSKHLRKLPVKQYYCVCHHSSPPMVMVSKQYSYTFTPTFSFMACTGTALTSSTLCYSNLNCTTVPKYGTYMFTVI